MKKSFLILSLIIVIIGVIPRSIELLNGNYLFGFDQGLFFEAVKKIVVDGDLTLIGTEVGGMGGFFQGSGWYYLLSVPFALSDGNPYAAMVLMFLIGLFTVISVLILSKRMYSWKEAFAIGFIVAISPLIIVQSRFIWPPFAISLLTVLFLFFLFQVLNKKEYFLPLLTFLIGVMVHFEIAIAGTLFAQVAILSPILFIKKLVSFKFFIFSIFSFLFTLSPLIIFDLRNNFLITNGMVRLVLGTNTPHDITRVYLMHMFGNHLDVFKYNFLSAFQLGGIIWPLLLLIILYGSFLIIKDKKQSWAKKAFIVYLLISPPMLFAIFMLYLWPMWGWWILEFYIIYSFLLGITSIYLFQRSLWKYVISIVFIAFFVSYINHTINLYRNDFSDYGGTHKIKGKLDAIDYIYKDAKNRKFNVLVFTPHIYIPIHMIIFFGGMENENIIIFQERKRRVYSIC